MAGDTGRHVWSRRKGRRMTTEERLEKLEKELDRAYRRNRVLVIVVGLCVGGWLTGENLGPGAASAEPSKATQKEVRADAFAVVGKDGRRTGNGRRTREHLPATRNLVCHRSGRLLYGKSGRDARPHPGLPRQLPRLDLPLPCSRGADRYTVLDALRSGQQALHSAIQYITPGDKLAGRAEAILAVRDAKLAAAREARKARRQHERLSA